MISLRTLSNHALNFAKTLETLGGQWDIPPREQESPLGSQAVSAIFETSDGATIYYEHTNDSGPPLFFVYGLGCSVGHWKYQIEYFLRKNAQQKLKSRRNKIIWMDFRGHGKSAGTDGQEISIDAFVEDIFLVAQTLNLKDINFLGQSMGGTIALAFCAKHPTLVKTLVLQGAPPLAPSQTIDAGLVGKLLWKNMIYLNRLRPKFIRALYRGLPKVGRPLVEIVRFAGFNPRLVDIEDVRDYVETLLTMDPNVFWELANDLEGFDVGLLESEIVQSALVIAGQNDRCVPMEKTAYLMQHLPNSILSVVPHGSHCPHLDDPDLVSGVIDQFLAR